MGSLWERHGCSGVVVRTQWKRIASVRTPNLGIHLAPSDLNNRRGNAVDLERLGIIVETIKDVLHTPWS